MGKPAYRTKLEFRAPLSDYQKKVVAAFEVEMAGRQYGPTETRDAFAWFCSGWAAGQENDAAEIMAKLTTGEGGI